MRTPIARLLAACSAALWACIAPATTLSVKADSRIEVVYITAKDCVYCRSWRYTMAGDWARFSVTPTGRNVQLVTVDKGTLRNPMKREYYPPEHAQLFDRAPQFGNVIPAWWVVLDGVAVTRRVGENTWRPDIEPVLEMLVKAKLAGGGMVEFGRTAPPVGAIPTAVDDADHVPFLSGRGKESYRNFLARDKPRAFALSADGATGWRSGGADPAGRALAACNARAIDFPCKLYVVDDAIVYKAD